MSERIEQRPTRREVLPYNGIRANTQPLCPEFWNRGAAEARLHDRQHHQASPRVLRQGIVRRRTRECVRHVAGSPVQADDTDGELDEAPGSTEERCSLHGGDERDAVLNGGLA